MQDILFFCSTITPRLRYTVKLLFEDMLGLSVNLTTSHEAYINAVLPRVNFSRNRIATNEIHILPFNQLLFDVQTLKKVTVAEIKNFLQHTEGGRLPAFGVGRTYVSSPQHHSLYQRNRGFGSRTRVNGRGQ